MPWGRFLQSILWPEIFAQSQSCEDMANFFYDIVSIGLDLLMPIKRIKKISADVPWMTDKLKTFMITKQICNKFVQQHLSNMYENTILAKDQTCAKTLQIFIYTCHTVKEVNHRKRSKHQKLND